MRGGSMGPNGRKPVMDPEIVVGKIARNLGRAAFDQVKEQADNVVTWEKAKLMKENEAEIIATKARGAQLYDRRNELTEILRHAPSGSPASLRLQRVYYCLVAALMILSSIFLAHMSLAAFCIGL